MRIWQVYEGDAEKFAELLANDATDVVFVGCVDLILTNDNQESVKDIVYVDKEGDVASYEVGDFSSELSEE